jgi:hypothetical protein
MPARTPVRTLVTESFTFFYVALVRPERERPGLIARGALLSAGLDAVFGARTDARANLHDGELHLLGHST